MSSSPGPSEGEPLCEGDTKVIYDVLPHPLREDIFARVRDEVRWQRMSHQGGEVPRLVAVQGDVDADNAGGGIPIYRHPADTSPPVAAFTPAVAAMRRVVEQRLGHPVNHVLIQLYRDGADYISEHSDKTLDIARDSFIANVSLGAERTMVLRTKRQPQQQQKGGADTALPPPPPPSPSPSPQKSGNGDGPRRHTQRARLPHNSLFQMGLRTNMRWLHGIRQDRRAERDKTADELAYGGERISLTFRRIATFLNRQDSSSLAPESGDAASDVGPVLIWGQGATAKTREAARPVINGQTGEAVAMLRAFGRENQASDFDWDRAYGTGFDVLHLSAAPRLFLSPDPLANLRVQLLLANCGVGYARGSLAGAGAGDPAAASAAAAADPEYDPPIRFVDIDEARTTVHGGDAIMRYIDRVYGSRKPEGAQDDDTEAAQERRRALFQEANDLLAKYRAASSHDPNGNIAALGRAELPVWAARAREAEFIAGADISLADFAFWPVLHAMVAAVGRSGMAGFFLDDGDGDGAALQRYYDRVKARDSVRRVLTHA